MASFKFRLQKVLEFRADREEAAKNAFLAKRSEVVTVEAQIAELSQQRLNALSEPRSNLEQFRYLEAELLRLDDVEREHKVVLSVLNDEAEALRLAWTRHKQDLETVEKLREKALEEWNHELNKREQAELDEWAVLRRKAA